MSKLKKQVADSQEKLLTDLARVLKENKIKATVTSLSLSEESCDPPCQWEWQMVKVGNSRIRMRVCVCPN
jgi:hypothetical protein